MDRLVFHRIGYAAIVLLLPYFISLFFPDFRESYPVLFFFLMTLALAGFISGILWLLFALELRGVWFGKEDRWRALKFQESDLPSARILGENLHEKLKPFVLFCWNIVLRPVISPSGEKAWNVRFDFVASSNGCFSPCSGFSEIKLETNQRYRFLFRASMEGDSICFFEFTDQGRGLPSPADKKISVPDLRHSERIVHFLESMFEAYPCHRQITGIAFHKTSHPFLRIRMDFSSEKKMTVVLGKDRVSCRPGCKETISFELHPDLTYRGKLKRLSLFGKIFSSI